MIKISSQPRNSGSFAVVLTALLAFAGCTAIPTSLNPLAVSLQYAPVANAGEFPSMPSCASISAIQVNDARATSMLGKRYVETNPSISAPVNAASDVRAWVRAGAESSAQRVGIRQDPGGPMLRLTIRQISTSENVARRSGYEGRILISADLVRKSGTVCWQTRLEGVSENYGYSGTADNYQETLNHALDRALIRLLSDPGFQRNICSCGG
jgi:hypothetical protein